MELQANQLEAQSAKLQDQAQKAIDVGREDLAREALTRKSGLTGQISDLRAQHAQLQGEEEKLTLAAQRLQAKVESFRTRKETIKATYTAAQAQTSINEAMSGIGEEMGDVGLAIQRAEDKTAQMQARAGAIDELIASGALDDVSSTNSGDDIARELDAMSSQSDVESELARLKGGPPAARPSRPATTAATSCEPPSSSGARPRASHDRPDPRRGPVRRRRGRHLDRLNELDARGRGGRRGRGHRQLHAPRSASCSTASAPPAPRTTWRRSTSPT